MTDEARTHPVAADTDRHATNLELFLDLVFVFAVTQIATLVAAHPTAAGYGRGALMAWLMWWQWSQFAWVGSAIDLQRTRHTRVIVLCIIPVALVNAVAVPEAFGRTAGWFAATYLGVLLLVLAVQGVEAAKNESTRAAFVRYASVVVIAPGFVLAGAFARDGWRVGLWCVAVALNVVGALRAASAGEWNINPVHFAERHALFVIIGLGEVLVSAGAAASTVGITGLTARGIVAAVAVACVMWWTYFAYIPEVTEHRLRVASGAARGRYARDVFTFGHFPLVVGIVSYAVVTKHLVDHPVGPLPTHDRWMLALAVVTFVGGLMAMQWIVVRKVAPERVVAVTLVVALCALGRHIPGLVLVLVVAVAMAVMQAVTLRRLGRR